MNDAVQKGPLRGRPYGGVMTLISRHYSRVARVICATDRYVVVVVGMVLIINTYLPCSGSEDRLDLCEEILDNLSLVISDYPCLLYTSPSPRDRTRSRMPSSA